MKFELSTHGMLSMHHLMYKKFWLCSGVLIVLAILTLSTITLPSIFHDLMQQDKLIHTAAYAGLMAWFAQIFRHDLTRFLIVIGLAGFGFSMEFVQGLLPYRRFDYMDMVANLAGIAVSWALAYTWVGNMFVRAEKLYVKLRASTVPRPQGSPVN